MSVSPCWRDEDSGGGGKGDKWGLVAHRAPGDDLGDADRIAGIEIAAAFEDFEHVFLIGEADQGGALGAKSGDVQGRIEGAVLGMAPLEIPANAVFAPGRDVGVVIVERRAAVGAGGHEGRVAQGRAGAMRCLA